MHDYIPVSCEVDEINGEFWLSNLKYHIHVHGTTLNEAVANFNTMFNNHLDHYTTVPEKICDDLVVRQRYIKYKLDNE